MHGFGFNRFAAKYLSRVKTDCSGTLPKPHTPWVINQFVSDYYKMFGAKHGSVWPYIGGNEASHQIDLFDRYDLDFVGTLTHDANGVLSDGTTGVGTIVGASTADLFPDIHNWSFGFYSRTALSHDTRMEMGGISGSGKMAIRPRTVAAMLDGYLGTSTVVPAAACANLGLFVAHRRNVGGVNAVFLRNGVQVSSITTASQGLPAVFYAISVANWGYSGRQHAFGFCCVSRQIDHVGFYNMIQTLQAHIGRNV